MLIKFWWNEPGKLEHAIDFASVVYELVLFICIQIRAWVRLNLGVSNIDCAY